MFALDFAPFKLSKGLRVLAEQRHGGLHPLDARTASGNQNVPTCSGELAVIANIDPDPAAPDVPPSELLAWVGVYAPLYLSSRRSFALYVLGWNVVDKIRRAKREGRFSAVLARWHEQAVELPRMWRSGRMFAGIEPSACVDGKPAL